MIENKPTPILPESGHPLAVATSPSAESRPPEDSPAEFSGGVQNDKHSDEEQPEDTEDYVEFGVTFDDLYVLAEHAAKVFRLGEEDSFLFERESSRHFSLGATRPFGEGAW